MITPSFGLTATERVLPKLALDFTTASLDARVTFTRTTGASNPATYVGSNGYITAATNNQPRFDYDPVALTCKGLLIEEQRSNLLLSSQTLGDANWVATNVTVSSNVVGVVAPDGLNTAESITDNATSGDHRVTQPVTTSTSTTYTASAYVKAGTGNYFFMSLSAGNLDDRYITVVADLTSGSITQTATSTGATLASSSVINAGNGWYRVTMTGSQNFSAFTGLRLGLAASSTGNTIGARGAPSYSGSGSVLYVWGAQLEVGAFATSYIPTTTTALTRNADVATMTGTNFSDWFNASEGTFVLGAMIASNADFKYLFAASTGAVSNIIAGRRFAGGVLADYVATGGSEVVDQAVTGTMTVNVPFNYAVGYKTNNVGHALNGGAIKTDTSAAIPTGLNILNIGARNSGFDPWGGWISSLRYFPQRLTDNEIVAFSK